MPTLSPNEVAKRSGMSRRSIMRAITKGSLVAKRTNTGWEIEESDYEAWAGAHAPADAQPMRDEQPLPTPENAVLEERIRGLEMLLAEMRRERDDLKEDRDAWRAMAQRPWWRRLAG